MTQHTTVYDYEAGKDVRVELPSRPRGHLSECLLFIDPTAHCTCDDDSPEWTL